MQYRENGRRCLDVDEAAPVGWGGAGTGYATATNKRRDRREDGHTYAACGQSCAEGRGRRRARRAAA